MIDTNITVFLDKLLLGVTLAAPIGPVSVEMINRGLAKGFWGAFSVRLGGALGNTICLFSTYFGLSQLMRFPMLMNTLAILGSLLLIYIGYKKFNQNTFELSSTSTNKGNNAFMWGLYLSVVNPFSLVFWSGIFAATMGASGQSFDLKGLLVNLFIILGVLLWGVGLSTFLHFGNKYLNQKSIVIISKIAAIFMCYFGIKYLWAAVQKFM